MARAWSRHLSGVVPRGYLQRAFKFAAVNKSGGFPVTAYDMKDAWERIKEQIDAEIDSLHREAWDLEDSIRNAAYWLNGFNEEFHHCDGSTSHIRCRERFAKDQKLFDVDVRDERARLDAINAKIERLRNGTN